MGVMLDLRHLTVAGAATLIAGCAGGMTAAECSGDWAALGEADGLSGAKPKLIDQRNEDCAGYGLAADIAAYEEGRARGLAHYCTDGGGFEAGRSGAEYLGICPAATEPAFLAAFDQGARLNLLTVAKEKAVSDYETAVADLDQHRYLMEVAEKRAAKASIGNEDREHERQEAEFRRREVVRIENDLPAMLGAIDGSRTALEAFKAELAAKGRTF